MPLIDDDPPRSLPRGIGMRRWPVPSSAPDEYSQLAAGFSISGEPDRDARPGVASRPASSTSTLFSGWR
jgi:hypothetical protein